MYAYRSSGSTGYGTMASSLDSLESLFDRFDAVLLPLARPSIALTFGELLADFELLPFFLDSTAFGLGCAAFLPFGAAFGTGAGLEGGRGITPMRCKASISDGSNLTSVLPRARARLILSRALSMRTSSFSLSITW